MQVFYRFFVHIFHYRLNFCNDTLKFCTAFVSLSEAIICFIEFNQVKYNPSFVNKETLLNTTTAKDMEGNNYISKSMPDS